MVGSTKSSPASTPSAPSKKQPSVVKSIPDIPRPSPVLNSESSRGIEQRNSVEIEERVRLAAKKFEVLQGNVQDLIDALKAQHQSIKTLDEDRLKVSVYYVLDSRSILLKVLMYLTM